MQGRKDREVYEQGFKKCIEMGQRWEVKEEGNNYTPLQQNKRQKMMVVQLLPSRGRRSRSSSSSSSSSSSNSSSSLPYEGLSMRHRIVVL